MGLIAQFVLKPKWRADILGNILWTDIYVHELVILNKQFISGIYIYMYINETATNKY
jgi:hypothetical protein